LTGGTVAKTVHTTADLIDTIHDCGVDIVFGIPGDGINGIMEALRKRSAQPAARRPSPAHPSRRLRRGRP
jgi:hypothetical protein